MRILFVGTNHVPVPPEYYGGIERVIADVATETVRRGHEVALLALPGSRLEQVACWSWSPWPGVPGVISYGLQALIVAQRFRADLVHCFGQTKWMVPWCLARGRALISYGVLPHPRVRRLLALCQDRILLAGCSDYISTAGERLVGGRWRTAHNCLDLKRYQATASVAPDAPLVFLSRIDPIKGVHIAIDIAERSGRRLIIAGNHVETGESGRYWLEDVKPRLNGSTVEYVGPINDRQKNDLLGRAAGLIVPIQWDEPFGLVFIEALACGTPVLSMARGALPEIVRNGIEGFLARVPDDLLQAIGRLDQIDRHGCRRRVEERFSTERTVDRYEALYQELLGRPGGHAPSTG